MGSVNMAMVVGHLGKDADLRYTPSGAAVANFSVATSDQWTDKASGERKERTEWHRCVLWGKPAESLREYLVKGKQVCVIGQLQTRTWEDRDGVKRYTTEIRVDRLTLLGGGNGSKRQSRNDSQERDGTDESGSQVAEARPVEPLTDDDIPF